MITDYEKLKTFSIEELVNTYFVLEDLKDTHLKHLNDPDIIKGLGILKEELEKKTTKHLVNYILEKMDLDKDLT